MRKIWRALFSRYTLSALVILMALGFLLFLIYVASAYSLVFYAALVIIDVVVVISIINREAHPEYKIPWLVITLIIPFFGVALYMIFYSRKLSRKEANLLSKIHAEAELAAETLNNKMGQAVAFAAYPVSKKDPI